MYQEVGYLRYQFTSDGLKPQQKKIEAMLRVLPPTNLNQLKRFIGMINFYCNIWKKSSHILAPLTSLAAITGKKKGLLKKRQPWVWKQEHQQVFNKAHQILIKKVKVLLSKFTKPFHIYLDASNCQLGATLVQEGQPLRFYTRKLNSTLNYTVGEKELLGIVEGIKAFEGIVRGFDLIIHTDHLNLLYNNLSNQQMIR